MNKTIKQPIELNLNDFSEIVIPAYDPTTNTTVDVKLKPSNKEGVIFTIEIYDNQKEITEKELKSLEGE